LHEWNTARAGDQTARSSFGQAENGSPRSVAITPVTHLTVPPNRAIDPQSLELIDFHFLRWSTQQRLFTVLGALTSMLKTSAQMRLKTSPCYNNSPSCVGRLPKRLKLTPADRIFSV